MISCALIWHSVECNGGRIVEKSVTKFIFRRLAYISYRCRHGPGTQNDSISATVRHKD